MAKQKSPPDAAAYTLSVYRDLIPPKVREEILNQLLAARLRGFDEFVDVTTFVIAHTLVGNIPPEVADTLKGYFELLFTAVSASALVNKAGGKTITAEAVERARAASRSRLESRVNLEQTSEGLKVIGLDIVPVTRPEEET